MGEVAGQGVVVEANLEAFKFTGNGAEFFRIWIVNILLTILTLGIYSAWAKVRTKSYFYGNTWLQGNTFAYLASPIAILKGRLIAVGFIVLWSVASDILPALGLLIGLFILSIIPWLICRSLRFNAINSSYRNVRFNFVGRWFDAAMAFSVWPLLGVLTLGLLLPVALNKQQSFMVGKSCYGTTGFHFDVPISDFYKICIAAIALMIVGAIVAAVLVAIIPPLAGVLGLLAYLVAFAYFRAHIFNVTYAGSTLAEHGFETSMTTAGIAWLYFSNMLAMSMTLGLFYPWARVRSARYMADSLQAKLAGPLDQFIAAETERVGALGEEMGDMLDLDIGL